MAKGDYRTREEVVSAALGALRLHHEVPEISDQDLRNLIEEGERSMESAETLDGEQALEERRARRAHKKGNVVGPTP